MFQLLRRTLVLDVICYINMELLIHQETVTG